MSREQPFNPATQRKEYDKTEAEISRVKSEITGDKSAEKIAELVAERERLMADLEAQKGAAHDQGNEDDKSLDDARIRIQELTEAIGAYKERITEITGKDTDQEQTRPDIESLQSSNEAFLSETFTNWYSTADAKKAKQAARFEKPETLDYASLAQDTDPKKFGEYTLNPDTQTLDFEKAKVFIPDLSAFVGKPRHEVMKHIVDTYGSTHHIPGIEYWKWAIENFDQAPQALKDGNWYYFPGSVLRFKDGRWVVPRVCWDGSKFVRNASWLDGDWDAGGRVVRLEK